MLKPGRCRGREQALFDAAEKIEALEIAPIDGTGLGEPVERADAGREIVQTGEVFEITAVATEQDFTQVHEAVDRLSDGGEGAGCRALPMFHLAVVFESGDVVGGGLQAQDEAEFVIDLDRGFAETMPDAGPLDPRCELTADLLGELGSDPVAEEGGDVFGFDSEDGLPGKLLIEGFEDGWRAEHQIRGVLDLHETPMVGLSEHVEHRTALLGVPIEDATQHVGREAIGKGLCAPPVVDAQEGVVGKGETDPGGGELAGQPAMPVAIELEAERTPCRHAQIDQAQFGVDEVEVVVQAFAGIRPQEGAMRLFVVPGLIGVAGFHRRDDMDQAGMVAAHGKYLGDDVFLADVLLGKVFDGDASRTGQFGSAVAHPITKRFGKSRIVEDPDLPRRKKPHHPLGIAGPGQRAGDDDPVVAGEHPGEALAVTLRQRLPQPPLPLSTSPAPNYYPLWFRLGRLRIYKKATVRR